MGLSGMPMACEHYSVVKGHLKEKHEQSPHPQPMSNPSSAKSPLTRKTHGDLTFSNFFLLS